MTSTTQNDTGRAGRPFLRMLQPEEPNAPFKDSSYFRLGSYVAYNSEEDPLVTHLATTRSRVSPAPAMPGLTAANGVNLMGPAFSGTFSAPSPGALSLEAIPSAPIPSSNDGVLLYTDHDLNETVGGAVLQKYGQGHVTQVTDCDSAYSVLNGKHDLFAQNGINIHAGTKAAPSNIHIVAEGHMTQIAYGDYKEAVSGNTHKEFFGLQSELFVGAKSSIFMDAENTVKLQTADTIQIGLDTFIRLGGRFNLTISTDANVIVGLLHTTTIGIKHDIILGNEYKENCGSTFKLVEALDQKFGNIDFKEITTDIGITKGKALKFTNQNIAFNNVSVTTNKIEEKKDDLTNLHTIISNKSAQILKENVDAVKCVQAAMAMYL